MSYNILNKNVNFQGATQGSIEDIVDTHNNQAITGSKDFNTLTGSNAHIGHVLTVGTHANNHAVCVAGDISGSGNISGSAFYANGVLLGAGGAVSSVANGVDNRIATFSSADALNGEENLTFDGSVLDFKATSISGSGNISGSQFYGAWAGSNINGSQIQLASGGGITDSTGLKLDSGVDAVGSLNSSDKILIFDADDSDTVKRTTAGGIAALAAVDSYGTQGANKVLIGAGGGSIAGAANLNFFGGNILGVTGSLSASSALQVGGTVKIDGSPIESPTVASDHVLFVDAGDGLITKSTFSNFVAAIAGDGLSGSHSAAGRLDVVGTGSIKVAANTIGLTASIAGVGLGFDGGIDSISEIKFDPNSLPDVAVSRNNDFIVFIDADDNAPKKESISDLVGFIAGTGLDASSGQLSIDVSDFLSNGVNNRIVTAGDADSLNAEANLSFDGNTLQLTGSMEMTGSGLTIVGGEASSAFIYMRADQADDASDSTILSVQDGGTFTISNQNDIALNAANSVTIGSTSKTVFTPSAITFFTGSNPEIPISPTYVKIDASGSSRTGMRFANNGVAGQFLIVENAGGENLTFDSNGSTALITTNADNDTMMPGEVFSFVSTGNAWFLIGGDLQAG